MPWARELKPYILFIFCISYMTFGLYLVKERAADAATTQAVAINNSTTCALRNLVDPTIAGLRRSIGIAQHVADDKGRNDKIRQTAKLSVRSSTKTLTGLLQFRAVYSTIPPGYRCPPVPTRTITP